MSRIAAFALMLAVASCTSCSTEPAKEFTEPPKEFTKPAKESANPSEKLTEPPKEFTSIGMKFKLLPAGEFLMGSPESDSDATSDEKPQHKVRITKPFYLGMYEVTQAEYEKVMGKNPSWFSKTGGGTSKIEGLDTSNFPVEQVSWDDAVEFCKRLSAQEGKSCRHVNRERNATIVRALICSSDFASHRS